MKTWMYSLLLATLPLVAHSAMVAVYNQVPAATNQTGNLIASAWYAANGQGSDADFYAYDSFLVSSDQAITEIDWRGGGGAVSNFTITIFDSIAGGSQPLVTNPQLPEFPLAKYSTGGNAGETLAGTFDGVALYDYKFVLPTPFQAVAGHKYWLRVEADQYVYPPMWGLASGTSGEGQHFNFSTGAARFYFTAGDTAFTLLTQAGPLNRVTATASPPGGGTVSGSGVYPSGLSASLVAAPNAGFVFVNWTDTGAIVSTTAAYTFTPTTNRTLVAHFAPAFTVTTGVLLASGGTTTGDGSYTYGSSVTVSATPNANYAFVNWTETGVPVSAAANYIFTASADRLLTANFVASNPNSGAIYTQPYDRSGTVIKSAWYYPGGQGLDGDQYTYDDFTLGTNAAMTEVRWRGGYTNFKSGASESPVADFTISFYPSIAAGSQPDITAQPLAQYAVGGNAGETLAGTFSGTPMYDYAFVLPTTFNAVAGTKCWIQIEASQSTTPFYGWPPDWGLALGTGGDGHYFYEVIGGTLGGGNLYTSGTGDTAFTLLGPATGNSIVTLAAPGDGGSVAGAGLYTNGASVTVVATSNPGYVFVSWNENGTTVSTSTNYQFTASASRTLVASFVQPFTIVTGSLPAGGGTTSGDGTYLGGADVAVAAVAAPGYVFTDWEENTVDVSFDATYYFTAGANRSLVAIFAPLCTVTTSVSPTNSGFTTGAGVFASGTVVTVVPTANVGYAFVNWTENGVPVSTSPSYTFSVSTNRALMANFAPACLLATSASSTNGSTSGGVYPAGATATALAVPHTGYGFANWTENGAPVSTSASYSFIAVSNRTLLANFIPDITSATFDFDTSAPALTNGQALPFDQTSGGVTAHFSSPFGTIFSVQTETSTRYWLSRFSGNYLNPQIAGSHLDIRFSQPINAIALVFATLDFQPVVSPSTLQLTAYSDATNRPAVGSAAAQGDYSAPDSMPLGLLTFSSPEPFSLVSLVSPRGAADFLVDNLTIGIAPQLAISVNPTNAVVLSWPAPAPNYLLQYNAACATTNWATFTNTIDVVGDRNQAVVAPPTGNSFYRLHRP